MNFSISVIIPTYQRAHLIGETIESILAQAFPALEVIVVDDGSTDDTAQVCAQFGSRIKYHKIPNSGVQTARNTGVNLSSSQWLAFCDSDDLWLPGHLQEIARLVASSPQVCFAYSNFSFFGENIEGPWKSKSMFDMAPNGFWEVAKKQVDDGAWIAGQSIASKVLEAPDYQPFWPSASSISRAYFDLVGGYDTRMLGVPPEDFEFMFRCMARGGQLGYTTRPTVRLRKHGENERGGGLRQAIGEIVVYGHVIRYHGLLSPLRVMALDKAYSRCADAMNLAFACGELDYVTHLSRIVQKSRYQSKKSKIKIAVASLPPVPGKILNYILACGRIIKSRPISPLLRSKLLDTVDALFRLSSDGITPS